jgi:predicted ATP-grasp superfamily ATP-dependent carboligase
MNNLIISSDEGIAIALLRCLSLHNSNNHVINVWKSNHASRFSRYRKSYFSYPMSTSIEKSEEFIEKVNEYCKEKKIDVIMATGLWGTFLLSKIKTQLRCSIIYPTPTAEQIRNLHNKWLFYNFLNENNLPAPKTMILENIEQLGSLEIEFPIILKPLTLENGNGVCKVESYHALEEQLLRSKQPTRLPTLVQEYIPGRDIVFGFLAKEGELVAWTMLERMPGFIKFFRDESLLELGRKIVATCGYHGAGNFDVRLDERDGQVKFFEFNPRFWVSVTSSLFYGVDFIHLGTLLAQGKDLPQELKKEVDDTQELPYDVSPFFFKGLISGKYPFQGVKKDVAWQTLLDPLPSWHERLSYRFGWKEVYDSSLLENTW